MVTVLLASDYYAPLAFLLPQLWSDKSAEDGEDDVEVVGGWDGGRQRKRKRLTVAKMVLVEV